MTHRWNNAETVPAAATAGWQAQDGRDVLSANRLCLRFCKDSLLLQVSIVHPPDDEIVPFQHGQAASLRLEAIQGG